MKHKYHIIFICLIFLFFPGTLKAGGDEYIQNIEITETAIDIDHQAFPPVAYLYVTLKNNGDRKISNATLGINYYGKGSYLIKKTVIKNALNNTMLAKETRKYKVRLNGNVFNARNEQYPYSQAGEVDEFEVKIINVKFGSR